LKNKTIAKAAISVLATFLTVSTVQSAQAETVLRLAHFAAEDHPAQIAAEQFKKNVEERTHGDISIELYPANELGSPPEQLEQTVLGVVDMNLPTQGALDKYEKAFATVMTPFAFKSYDEAHQVLDGPFMEWVAPKLEKKGLVMLSNWEYGFRNVTNSVRPINSPEDMVGLKLRTPPEIQIVAALEALGAQTTQIAFPELPGALTAGVVDGQENPISVIFHNKLYELQHNLALTHHVYNSMVHVINKDKWDSLTTDEQKIVREASVSAGNLMRKLVQDEEASDLDKIKAAGVEITEPDLAKFKAKMGPAYERVKAYAGEENMKTFMGFLGK
jgi:tripartite ATP-independent transporter DctP family solute receptor